MSITSSSSNQQQHKASLLIFNQIPNKGNITILNFSNCKISKLPPDLSQFTNLTSLDLSNNPLTDFESIAQSLSTLPQLKELSITLPSPSSLKVLLTHVPNLQLVNNKPIACLLRNTIDLSTDDIHEANLDIEIDQYKALLEEIIALIPRRHQEQSLNSDADAFQASFRVLLNEQYAQVNKIINDTVPNYLYGVRLLKIKSEIYQFFQCKLIELISYYNGTKTVETILRLLTGINSRIEQKEDLMTRFIGLLSEKISTSTLNESNDKEIGLLRKQVNEKSEQNNLLEQENQALRLKADRLEEENRLFLTKCIDKAKTLPIKASQSSTLNKEEAKSLYCSSASNGFMSSSTSKKHIVPRALSKESLLEIIKDIYASKLVSNNKCRSTNMPIDTLEHHMYKHLNQKYGLKSITLEYAAGIIQAIKDYSIHNSEICLFGKILRNEIEESSITLLSKIKESTSEALTYFLQQKHKTKDLEEIKAMAFQLKSGLIEEEMWIKLIDFLFVNNKNDRDSVKKQIYSFIGDVMEKSIQRKATELNSRKVVSYQQMKKEKALIEDIANYQKKIAYEDLLDAILLFHIRTRDRYLKNFKKAFALYDKDRNGVISEDDFYSLITVLDIYPKEVINVKLDLFLNQLPQENRYSFSEVVDLLENDRLSKTLSAMDAIAMKPS